jgi:hypothetical protein
VDATDGRCGRLTHASGAGRAGDDAAPVHPSHSSKVGPPEDRVGAREENAGLVGIAVDGIADGLDAQRVALLGDEEFRHLGQLLWARAGDLERRAGRGARVDGEVSERLGDGPRGDELGTQGGHVSDVPLCPPLQQLLDELVELGGAEHPRRYRPGEHRALVRDLRDGVAAMQSVGVDDRHHDDALHAAR